MKLFTTILKELEWWKISSENYQSKNILIFPNDVELADIGEDISVGMKIRFRPRVEGNLTYASDIRLVTI